MATLLRFFAAGAGMLPWAALRAIGDLLGWTAGSLLRIRRKHVVEAMRTAGVANPARTARAMYRSLGVSAMEFLWLASRGASACRHCRLSPEAAVAWDRAAAQNRGIVIAASHTGNWDLAACAMATRVPLLVVTKNLALKGIDQFWQRTRAMRGVELTLAAGAMRRARAWIESRGAVVMMIDQVPMSVRGTVKTQFLGQLAFVDRAAAALAARQRSPLVVAAAQRNAQGEHILHVLEVMEPPRRPGPEWIDATTIAATHALERFVRANPSQWLWMHRRWREPKGVAPLASPIMLSES